jgi:regulator of RNase E activity RraA
MANGRCRLDGGLSTGPKTAEGIERIRRAVIKHGYYSKAAKAERAEYRNLLNLLQAGDVIVVDAHAISGGIIGDNLAYYIYKKGAGFVIDGEIRDLDGIREFDMTGYYREAVPSFLTNCMVAGINVPVTIGKVTVMPGDVVFGDTEGVYFIPPQLVKEVVDRADETHVHDEWTKKKLDEGKYKSTDIYPSRDPALKKEYGCVAKFVQDKFDQSFILWVITHAAFNPNMSLTNWTCPTTSPFANHRTWHLRIICRTS